VTTGYRWLVPDLHAQRPRPAAMFASVINSAVAGFIGHPRLTQAWGGSMALRADFARQHRLADHLRGALSDDYQMTRLCRAADRRVYFVYQCLVASPVDFTWPQLLEFGRRQYLITRVHDPKLYLKGLGLVTLYLLAWLSCWACLAIGIVDGNPPLIVGAGLVLLAVGVCNHLRAGHRRQAIKAAFGRDMLRYLRHTLRLDRFGTAAVMAVNLTLLLSAGLGRTLTWRSHRYRLRGPQNIQRLS
jgi:hypothetical protein